MKARHSVAKLMRLVHGALFVFLVIVSLLQRQP